jgi:hypothetical protein
LSNCADRRAFFTREESSAAAASEERGRFLGRGGVSSFRRGAPFDPEETFAFFFSFFFPSRFIASCDAPCLRV